jgi:hypothetical protein
MVGYPTCDGAGNLPKGERMARVARGTAISGPDRLLVAAVAGVLGVASAASGQFGIGFDPPEYTGSAAGEPLAGQDGWEVESGEGVAWRVHKSGHGLPGPLRPGQFIAAHSSAGPAIIARETGGIERSGRLRLMMAVDSFGGAVSTAEIGSWSLAPQDESAGFTLHAVWSDPAAPGRWRLEVSSYAADGSPQRVMIPGAEALDPGRWYVVSFTIRSYSENQIDDVWFREGFQYHQTRSHKPVDWYLAGGAAGGLPAPTAVSVESSLDASGEAVFAMDDFGGGPTAYYAYSDCNHDGTLDFFDYLCFQEAFAAGASWADCNASGEIDFFDFLCFQDCFAC